MNEAWKRIFREYIECYNGINVLEKYGIVEEDYSVKMRDKLLEEIIGTMKSEVED